LEEVTHRLGGSGDWEELIEVEVDAACEHASSVLDGGAHGERELRCSCHPTLWTSTLLGTVFGDGETPVREIEDLAADNSGGRRLLKPCAACQTGFRLMNDELVGFGDLPERGSTMTELTAGQEAAFLSEAAGARDFLPGRVGSGRQGGVMGVARDARAAVFDRVLQLSEASQELVVELLLHKQLCVASGEGLPGSGEFFGERDDDGLRLADGLRFQLVDTVCEAVNEADDSLNTLRVNLSDVSLAEQVHCRNRERSRRSEAGR
jgi:hypothetical protein